MIVQIESLAAAARADEIAEVPGIDGLFPGAADMAADAHVPDQLNDPRVAEAVKRVLDVSRQRGLAGLTVAADRVSARFVDRLAEASGSPLVAPTSTHRS